MNPRNLFRIAAFALIVLSVIILASSYNSYAQKTEYTPSIAAQQAQLPFDQREPIIPPRDDITVITGLGFGDRPGDALIAFAPDGRVLY